MSNTPPLHGVTTCWYLTTYFTPGDRLSVAFALRFTLFSAQLPPPPLLLIQYCHIVQFYLGTKWRAGTLPATPSFSSMLSSPIPFLLMAPMGRGCLPLHLLLVLPLLWLPNSSCIQHLPPPHLHIAADAIVVCGLELDRTSSNPCFSLTRVLIMDRSQIADWSQIIINGKCKEGQNARWRNCFIYILCISTSPCHGEIIAHKVKETWWWFFNHLNVCFHGPKILNKSRIWRDWWNSRTAVNSRKLYVDL